MSAPALDETVAVAVEGLARQSPSAAAEYMPATSIFQRLFRREWQGITLGEDAGVDDEDDDEEDELFEEESADDPGERWALRDVTFSVPRGTALALVGPPAGGRVLLLRILAGQVPPTAGRALIRGRRGPTVEAASKLMRQDMHPDQNLKLLAGLLDVPRSERGRFVDATLELAFGVRRGTGGADLKNAVLRVASAVAFDPTADVLLVDELPGEPRLRARCLEQLAESLAGGATALISSDELDVLRETATAALWLERGRVVAFGAAADVIRDLERREGRAARRRPAALRPFDDSAAILELAAATHDGSVARREGVELRILLETVEPHAAITFRVRIRDEDDRAALVEGPCEHVEAGRYRVVATLPALLLDQDGEYRIELEATVEADGERSLLGREIPLRVRPGPEDDPDVVEETVGEAGGPVEGDPVAAFADWTIEPLA